jgi:hypothetical protein
MHASGPPPPLTSAALERRLVELQPDVMRDLDRLRDAAWKATDPEMLELCRLRLAQLLNDDEACARRSSGVIVDERLVAALGEWRTSELFDASHRAHLEFTEQFSISVANITDAEVDGLLRHLTDEQLYAFAAALYVIEMEMRLRRVARLLLT